MTSLTNTITVSGPLRRGRNLFRFPHTEVRLRIESRPAKEPDAPPTCMTSISEQEFDDLDVTAAGQPSYYCILAPGLAAVWPTPYNNCTITVYGGAS